VTIIPGLLTNDTSLIIIDTAETGLVVTMAVENSPSNSTANGTRSFDSGAVPPISGTSTLSHYGTSSVSATTSDPAGS
jgi:hypothetical protein